MNKKQLVHNVGHALNEKYREMWTRNLRSGTIDYPSQRDVYLDLVGVLIKQSLEGKWAHFEVDRLTRGLIKFFSSNPWVEVELESASSFILRYKKKKDILFPETWKRLGKRSLKVPVRDRQLLVTWLEDFFRKHNPETDDYVIVGWIDGFKKGEKVVS